MVRKLAVFLTLSSIFSHLIAGTTGKITGIVRDQTNNTPLPGVNILIEGTLSGASSDIDGYYVILNAPVGLHQLNISYIGYQGLLIYNIKVSADATTRLDFKLEPVILELSESIDVVAERELIQLDNTSSQTIIPSELLATQPVDNITQTASMAPGFTEGSYRGGRVGVGEIKFLLDGVDVTSPLVYTHIGKNPGQTEFGGGNAVWEPTQTMGLATDIPEASLEEVQVITGGMGPEYNAKSAVINVITKTSPSVLSGYARVRMTPSLYGNGKIIPHDFGQVSGFMSNEEAIAEAKRFGTGSRYENDGYYSSPSQAFVNPNYRRYEAGIGGPVNIESIIGNGRMSFSLNLDIFDTGGFYRGQFKQQETAFGKWTYQTTTSDIFSFNFLYSHMEMLRWYHNPRIVSTGDTVYQYTEGAEEPYWFLIGSIVHPDGRLEEVNDYDMMNNELRPESLSNMLSFSYKNIISSKTFYELKISRFKTSQKIRSYDPATGNPLGLEDYAERRFANLTDPIYFPTGANTAYLMAESYWWVQPMWIISERQDDNQIVWNFSADFRSQLNEFNELQMGVKYTDYDLIFNYQAGQAGIGQAVSNYQVYPKNLSLYLTDKIETDGMIINAGIRFDYFDPNAILPENAGDPVIAAAKDPFQPLFWDVNATAEERIKNPKSARTTKMLMPRLGISFPVSELDVVMINYGHYFAMPPLGELYNNYTWHLAGAKLIGNADLREEKTISYEIGIEHGFNPDIKLRGTVFYKDIADLVNYKKYYDNTSGVPYWAKINADFANAYGIELSLTTRRWYNFLAQASYTYQFAQGKSSHSSSAFFDDDNGRRLRTESFPLDWDVRHTVVASIDYRVPQVWLDSEWLGDWGVSMLLNYNSGRPYTSPQQTPPPGNIKLNDERYPDWLKIDVRLFKNIPLWKNIRFGAFLEVYNFFNERTIRQIRDTEKYYDGLDDGDGIRNDPSAWSKPRHYRLGFEILF